MQSNSLIRPLAGLFLIFSAPSAHATFVGEVTLAGGWPTAQINAGADWSSDLGPDYRFGFHPNDQNNDLLAASGDGTYTTNRPLNRWESDFTLDYRLNSRGGAVGDTYSGGQISMGKSGDIDQAGPTRLFLYSHLGANASGYGISTNTWARQLYHYLLPSTPYQKLYWAMDYTIRVETSGFTWQSVYIQGPDGSQNYLLSREDQNGSSDTISGTLFGEINGYWYNGTVSYSQFSVETALGDASQQPGAGTLSVEASLRYSTSPVPEPASMIVLGLGTLALLRKKR